ncbi:hypothetical protein G7K_1168-t1 [Saitoella complicata NRRL Y-17804]|uniref:Velvet domain-containing protein n=1 Tax=Saitoella complicata (strain BCRC 22490 / CBS 7301 / JCM 7358 / NBRC 10748 / NRRL Y-17804) TaxID=698492 RepID=A0A0E9NB85_SAICN|nr:hypothetical protein G7K_1168-t1 [Saitoella complicata NRRL Y-17804]
MSMSIGLSIIEANNTDRGQISCPVDPTYPAYGDGSSDAPVDQQATILLPETAAGKRGDTFLAAVPAHLAHHHIYDLRSRQLVHTLSRHSPPDLRIKSGRYCNNNNIKPMPPRRSRGRPSTSRGRGSGRGLTTTTTGGNISSSPGHARSRSIMPESPGERRSLRLQGIPAASLDIAESIRGRRRSQTRAAQAGEMLAQEHTHEAAETAQPTSPSLPNPPPAAITSRDEEDLALQAGGSVLQAGGSPTNVQSHAHAVQFRMEIASIAREADPSSPLDPPLIVRLRVHDPNSNDILGEQYHPHLLAHVGLYDEHGINILSPPDRYLFRGPNLAASPAIFNEPDLTLEAILGPDHTVYSGSAPSHRSVFFVYPGLHITRPGRYRMRLRLVGIGSDSPGGGGTLALATSGIIIVAPGGHTEVSPAAARLVASINAQIAVALQSSSTSDLSTSNSSGSGSASSENAGSSPVLPYRPPYPAHPPVGTPP